LKILPEVKHFIKERKRKSTETPKVMASEIGLATFHKKKRKFGLD